MKKLDFLFLFLALSISVQSQTPYSLFKLDAERETHRSKFFEEARKINHDDAFIERCYSNCINLLKEEEFSKLGHGTIAQVLGKPSQKNVARLALLAPIVVIGKVIKREYDPRSHVYYHTSLTFKVDRVVSSGAWEWDGSSNLTLKLTSGPVGNYFRSGSHIINRIYLGENILLFLDPISEIIDGKRNTHINFLKKRFNENEFTAALKKRMDFDFSDENIFLIRQKYSLKNNYLFSEEGARLWQVEECLDVIKKVTEINNVNDFIDVKGSNRFD